jgi:hypothetical protein
MNLLHTPGPWVWREQGEANNWCIITNSQRWVIGFAQNGELATLEQKANARLIAAAPDLLGAALLAYVRLSKNTEANVDILKMLGDAIAKAVGQSTYEDSNNSTIID